jgi:hypothetical protein
VRGTTGSCVRSLQRVIYVNPFLKL